MTQEAEHARNKSIDAKYENIHTPKYNTKRYSTTNLIL